MTVNPLSERAADLPILEQTILLVCRVKRDPLKGPNLQLHSRAGFDAPFFSDDADRGKRRVEKFQGVFPLMECKYALDRAVKQYALDEGRQLQFSVPARAAMPRSIPLKTNSCSGQTEYQ